MESDEERQPTIVHEIKKVLTKKKKKKKKRKIEEILVKVLC